MEKGDLIAHKYRLEHCLGQGGMGEVWAATHEVTKKTLALKFVKQKAGDAGAQRRALREARAACAVAHPNVVAVHDVLESELGLPVLVMDLLHGESLAQRIARERTLSPEETVRIVKEVLAALSVAHGVGVVHRDLKPDNVFLESSGGVKILDFGIAKLRGSDGPTKETHRLTESGAMVGTPHYMSPEQAFGEVEIDPRADLFSVGAVMYECLSGSLPTDGQNLGQILKALATGKIKPIGALVPDLDKPLAALVDRLLAVEPADRPASADEVLASLANLGQLPSDAHVPAARDARTSAASQKHGTPPPATRDASRPPPPRRIAPWAAGAIAVLGVVAVGMWARPPQAPTPTSTMTPTSTTTPTSTSTPTPITISTSTSTSTSTPTPTSPSPSTTTLAAKPLRPAPSVSASPALSAAPKLLGTPY